ncbi:MAG TPA: SAM-dependent methyltransferase [Acholeplasmataceae bacterium]|nr:SAM-dependent methyltransferase [Acholeplasmataceae bacterium]
MTKRIKAIAEFITPYKYIADVGYDHGYLILEAFEKYNIVHAQAIDNKKGPLESAYNNLKKYYDNITFSLSNGISDLERDIEVVIIAGMGGMLIINILKENIEKLKNVKRIIVQPNRDIDKVRKFAISNGYKIVSEKIIEEESIIYEIIVLEKGSTTLNEQEIMFGPLLLKERSPIFIKKWKKEYLRLKNINTVKAQKKAKLINDTLLLEEINDS